MDNNALKRVLESILEGFELPDYAYEKARDRYEDLGEWFCRKESSLHDNEPHIFPQGSFRLGTAIKPINSADTYDLDLACELQNGISTKTHSQKALKTVIKKELEAYRVARGIRESLKEKHRCWRLEYQDNLSFHMDIIPCIPADTPRKEVILESIRTLGFDQRISDLASKFTVFITDDRHSGYELISDDWNISNPEGYATWFFDRMNLEERMLFEANIDELPRFKTKTPLQRSVQLLKRHRDKMFQGYEDIKPSSIIITTLAAKAYQGERDILTAISGILQRIERCVNRSKPRVPNPVDPNEDFADRWSMQEYQEVNLEQNFWQWLRQAKADLEVIVSRPDPMFISEQAHLKFATSLNESELKKLFGSSASAGVLVTPKIHEIVEPPAKPWIQEQ